MITDPEKLIGKRVAYNTMGGTAFGVVRAMTMSPDVVLVERGYGKSRSIAKVNMTDIVKVYEKK